jgi:thymidylate synthase (FAD)
MNWQPGTDRHFLYKNTKMKVELLEIFGNDDMVANAARVSFGKEASNYTVEQNEKLIKYLAEHNHTSPFRHPQIQYRITCPIFVERQLFKHQVGLTANSISGRYVDFQDNYYKIEDFRIQSKSSKQGSAGDLDKLNNVTALMIQNTVINCCATAYHELLQLGVAKEQARTILPLNLETTFIWTGSLLAYINFWKLRITRDTQAETMQIAQDMLHELKISTNGFEHSLKAFHI